MAKSPKIGEVGFAVYKAHFGSLCSWFIVAATVTAEVYGPEGNRIGTGFDSLKQRELQEALGSRLSFEKSFCSMKRATKYVKKCFKKAKEKQKKGKGLSGVSITPPTSRKSGDKTESPVAAQNHGEGFGSY